MKIIEIIGQNYFGHYTSTRTACRVLVVTDGRLLLSYETKTDTWQIPGGGVEDGEDDAACCVRELVEETGVVIRPLECLLEIDEYYEDCRFVSRYFRGTEIGTGERRLTRREAEVGMEPRVMPLDEIMEIFSHHRDYADTDEMKRGMYLREYTALCELFGQTSDR